MGEFVRQKQGVRRASDEKSVAHGLPVRGIPNSAHHFEGPDNGFLLPNLDEQMQSRMQALQHQIPAAEREADRLSQGVHGRTFDEIKSEMGERLGADLSGLRLHQDAGSMRKAAGIGAQAYTSGRDIYFGSGGFDPAVAAHEIVHTAQQGAVESGGTAVSAPMGGVQMKPLDTSGHSKKMYLFDRKYRNIRSLSEKYESETDPAKKEALKSQLLSEAKAYRSAHTDSAGNMTKHTRRTSDADDIINQLESPDAPRMKLLSKDSGMDKATMNSMNASIRQYNGSMKTLHSTDANADARSQAQADAKSAFMGMYQRTGGMDQSKKGVSQLNQQLMNQLFDIQDGDNEKENKAFRTTWGSEFAQLQNQSQTGRDLFGQLFDQRYNADASKRHRLTLINPQNEQNASLAKPFATASRERDPLSMTAGKALVSGDEGSYVPGAGSDALVHMPSLAHINLFKAYSKDDPSMNLQDMGKMMAAHEMTHALHYMSGMSLAGKTMTANNDFVTNAADKQIIPLEELATTGLKNHSTSATAPTSSEFLAGKFAPDYQSKAKDLYDINEDKLREELGLPKAVSYSAKHEPSQFSTPAASSSNRLSKQQFDAIDYVNKFTKNSLDQSFDRDKDAKYRALPRHAKKAFKAYDKKQRANKGF